MDETLKNISLTKEEMKQLNDIRYQELFEPGGYYFVMSLRERRRIAEIRKEYEDDMEFYKEVAYTFAKKYIPLMISEHRGKLPDSKIEKLNNLLKFNNIQVLMPGAAVSMGYVKADEAGRPISATSAFTKAKAGIIGFTPEATVNQALKFSKSYEERKADTIEYALKMEGLMIHNTYHLLVDLIDHNEEMCLTSQDIVRGKCGFILNEGTIEKLASEFALKNNLMFNPLKQYFQYADFASAIESKLKPDTFERMAFNCKYMEILNKACFKNQITEYCLAERKKQLEKLAIKEYKREKPNYYNR